MEPVEVIPEGTDVGAFHSVQKAAGADFYEDYGRLWTKSFGDPDGEYWSVRRDAGLWDVYALIKWRFTGPDALAALNLLTTRHMTGAEPGTIRYGMILDEKGKMLDEGTNYVLAADEAYWMGNDDREAFADHVGVYTSGLDVEVENATARIPNLALQGPRSLEVLSGLTKVDLSALGYFRVLPEPVEVAGVPCMISRTGFTGEIGYELYLMDEGEGAESLWNALTEAGARPFGLGAVEKLRIEMGFVIQEEDYFPGVTSPFDCSLEGFIDFHGHEFVGQEAVNALRSSPPQRFKTLELQGDDLPPPGATVTHGDLEIGVVRSADRSPRLGSLALAMIDTPYALDGEEVQAGWSKGVIRPIPFDDQGRARTDPRKPARILE